MRCLLLLCLIPPLACASRAATYQEDSDTTDSTGAELPEPDGPGSSSTGDPTPEDDPPLDLPSEGEPEPGDDTGADGDPDPGEPPPEEPPPVGCEPYGDPGPAGVDCCEGEMGIGAADIPGFWCASACELGGQNECPMSSAGFAQCVIDDLQGGGLCGVLCEDIGGDADCPEGMYCQDTGQGIGLCTWGPEPSDPPDEPTECGDGVFEGDEECDDGNWDDTDYCLSDCTLASCGDGFVQVGVEECDDGNVVAGDGCDAGCLLE